jgi:hypothetical protein
MSSAIFAIARARAAIRLLICLAIVSLFSPAALAVERRDQALWRPRLPTPAFVALDSQQGREFIAEVRGPANAGQWRATVANDLQSWDCQVVAARFAKINRETEPGWQLRLRVPADTPPELFDLTVSCDQFTSVQNQALSAVPNFTSDFYILHLSDEQIVNDKHTDPSGQYCQTVGTVEEMYWMQGPINLIHPRFACVTGDQIDFNGALDGWNNWPNWGYEPGAKKHFSEKETLEIEQRLSQNYLECHRGYHVPYVEAPGNHDVTPADKKLAGKDVLWHPISVRQYEQYFGQRSWSMRMGDFYVLMHDWTERELKDWAAADYAAALADPTVKFRLIAQHFHTDQAFVPENADLMLIGHGHTTATIQTSPYYIYEDGPTFKYGTTGFFNFRRSKDGGWICDQTAEPRNTHQDVWHLFTDNGVTKLVRSDQPDSNHVTTRSITITNDLPREFYDGRVRFVLEKGKYDFVRNGVILAEYDCANEATKTAIDVKVDIPAKGTVTVTVESPAR